MILKLKRTPGIYIVGFMGSGKTTVGRMLADEIGWRFADLDEDIEHEQRASISHVFAAKGEDAFREMEREALMRRVSKVQSGHPLVLALGGGTFTREDNIELLCEHGVTVWLDVPFEIVQKRVSFSSHRPLAKDPQRFADLFEQRRPFYERAEYRVQVTRNDSRQAVSEILSLPFLKVK